MYDFSNIEYTPSCSVLFRVPTVEDTEDTILVRTSMDFFDDETVLTVWAAPSSSRYGRKILRARQQTPDDVDLDDMAYSIVNFLLTTPQFVFAVQQIAKQANMGPFTVDCSKEFPITILPMFHFACPEEITPDFLPAERKNELTMDVEFDYSEDGNCTYFLSANVETSPYRVMVFSNEFIVPCVNCEDESCENRCTTLPYDIHSTEIVAQSILKDISEYADDIHETILNSKNALLNEVVKIRPLHIQVSGTGKNMVFVVPEGVSEDEAEAIQALQRLMSNLTDDEEDEE